MESVKQLKEKLEKAREREFAKKVAAAQKAEQTLRARLKAEADAAVAKENLVFAQFVGKVVKSVVLENCYEGAVHIEFTDGSSLGFGAQGDDATYLTWRTGIK